MSHVHGSVDGGETPPHARQFLRLICLHSGVFLDRIKCKTEPSLGLVMQLGGILRSGPQSAHALLTGEVSTKMH